MPFLIFTAGFIISVCFSIKIQCIALVIIFTACFIFYQIKKIESAGIVIFTAISIFCFYLFGNLIGNVMWFVSNSLVNSNTFTKEQIIQLNQPQLELVCYLNNEKHFLINYKIEYNNIINEKGLIFNKNNCDIKKGE